MITSEAVTWRAMTWNMRGSSRPDLTRIADVIRSHSPDVVAIQEIRRNQTTTLAANLGWTHVWARKHYPYTPIAWRLAEGLAIMSPNRMGDVRRRSLTPRVSTSTHRHRVVLASTVERDADRLRIYDTHLAAHNQPDERIKQAERVVAMIEIERAPYFIVAGDLNAAGEVEVVRPFHAVRLRDPGGGPTNPAIAPRSRLDYILVPERSEVIFQHQPDGGQDWWELSDHVPVIVEFTIDAAAATTEN